MLASHYAGGHTSKVDVTKRHATIHRGYPSATLVQQSSAHCSLKWMHGNSTSPKRGKQHDRNKYQGIPGCSPKLSAGPVAHTTSKSRHGPDSSTALIDSPDNLPVSETLAVFLGLTGFDWLSQGQADLLGSLVISLIVGVAIHFLRRPLKKIFGNRH